MLAKRIVARVRPQLEANGTASTGFNDRVLQAWVDSVRRLESQGADEVLFGPEASDPSLAPMLLEVLRRAEASVLISKNIWTQSGSMPGLIAWLQAGVDHVFVPLDQLPEASELHELQQYRSGPCLSVVLQMQRCEPDGPWMVRTQREELSWERVRDEHLTRLEQQRVGQLFVRFIAGCQSIDFELLRTLGAAVQVPVLAEVDGCSPERLRQVFTNGQVDGVVCDPATLDGVASLAEVKHYLAAAGIVVRGLS